MRWMGFAEELQLLKLPLAGLETGNDTSFCDILPAFFKEGGT